MEEQIEDGEKSIPSSSTSSLPQQSIVHSSDSPEPESYNHQRSPTTTPAFNPPLPSEIDEKDIEKIKGDAIGDTLYSERYVLSVLLKLPNIQNNFTEENEKDLCTLWDMTIEKDVVKLLLQHDVLELFSLVIQSSENVRLTEIIVGIIGNMCCFPETRTILCNSPEIMNTIINLIDNDDALTLIQLMRFFKTTLVFENSGDELVWFQHFKDVPNFIEKFSFLLTNSTSTTLLLHAFEALNSIFNKFSVIEAHHTGGNNPKHTLFQETFVKPCLVSGMIEAFKQALPDSSANDMSTDAATSLTERNQKIMNIFIEINVHLSQYENLSEKIYQPYANELFDCIQRILTPLCLPVNLFPLTPNTQDIIENVNEIFQSLGDPFDTQCFVKFTLIWSNIKKYQDEMNTNNENGDDEWGGGDTLDDDDVSSEDICMTILDFITRVNKNSEQLELETAMRSVGLKVSESLLKEISVGDSEPDIEKCCIKLRTGLKNIWNM